MSDTLIGVARPRLDAPEKVTGATRYGADGYVHGLLHARPVLAPDAHARIRNVDREAALAVDGVVAVLLASDFPISSPGTDRTSEPLAREEVVFAGQPVALVVGRSEAAAQDGAEALVIEYESLEAVVDVESAMQPGAALARVVEAADDEAGDLESIHAGVDHGQVDDPGEQFSANVLDRVTRADGDVAAAFAASDVVVEGTFRTPWVYQAYLEPQVCTAWLEPSGSLVVSTSTQGSFVTRNELARAFDLPLDGIRVIAEPLGGAFGGCASS
jgi:CO/xanthine dehydrogenase Mo-binding subunit